LNIYIRFNCSLTPLFSLARTNSPTLGVIGSEITTPQSTENAKQDLILDIGQLVLDITGIIDPTPLSDGTSALISMGRGNGWDAAISAISIIPYVGDVAKLGKLPRYLISIEKAIDIAKIDLMWASKLRPVLKNLKPFLDKVLELGAGTLPKSAMNTINRMKKSVDGFLIRNSSTGDGLGTSLKQSQEKKDKLNRPATGNHDLKNSSQNGLKTSRDMSTMEVKSVVPNSISVRQNGLDRIPLPRTEGLGAKSTTQELLQTGAIPGPSQGVILDQRTVVFDDIWQMSERSGVEFILTKENGDFLLRSGSRTMAPIKSGQRPIVHTHPIDEFGRNSPTPSLEDIDILNAVWERNPNGARPRSQILVGTDRPTLFHATGLEKTPKKNPLKR